MAHRLALAAWRGHGGAVPTYIMLEALSGGVAATRTVTFTATTPAQGTIALYIAGRLYEVSVAGSEETATTIAENAVAVINADAQSAFTAGNSEGVVTLTAKDTGVYGNSISVHLNARQDLGEVLPSGVTCVIANGTSGAGVPNVAADIAAGLGVGDSANEAHFTDVVTGYGDAAGALGALAQYVGEGQADVGLYADAVARPFRSLYGSIASGSAGLQQLIASANNRKNDRCNGVVCRPGSMTPPAEIAAEALARCAMVNHAYPGKPYVGEVLSGVDIGAATRRDGADWTTDYAGQDLAVKNGVGFLLVKGGSATCSNVISHFRPANIPEESNAYREFANISKIQNILWNTMRTFQSVKWQGFIIVSNVANVGASAQRNLCRDIGMVKATLLSLIDGFYDLGLLYEKEFSIAFLRTDAAVQVRPGGDGFTNNMKYKLSGVGNILDTTIAVDTRVA
jgi:phage tail sheath gpL-like